jgi:hypothetical protein
LADVNQLLNKALSTSSDEEAISCLNMARKIRKKTDTFETGEINTGVYNTKTAEEWYNIALKLHNNIKTLKKWNVDNSLEAHKLREVLSQVRKENYELKLTNEKKTKMRITPVTMFFWTMTNFILVLMVYQVYFFS